MLDILGQIFEAVSSFGIDFSNIDFAEIIKTVLALIGLSIIL